MTEVQKDSRFYNRETNAYCYLGEEKPNHDSVIIGWDDHFPKERFQMEPERDGAFLCTNSWGEGFGDQGYFYVSYEDSNIGVHNIVYTGVEPVDNYDRICQTDLCGWMGQIGYGEETVWFANAYESYGGEELMAAGFYATMENTSLRVVCGQTSGKRWNGGIKRSYICRQWAGWSTVDFIRSLWRKKVDLDEGEKFAGYGKNHDSRRGSSGSYRVWTGERSGPGRLKRR